MPDETRAVRMADLPEIYQAPAEGGQGESSGPSLFSLMERFPTGFYDCEDGVRRPYWITYGSQEREMYLRRDGGSVGYSQPITYEVLRSAWDQIQQPIRETTRERGEQMRFSGKPDPLTPAEMTSLEQFYRKVLRDGFAPWPLEGLRLPIFIDGKARRIYQDTRWACQEEYIYIGSRLDEGSGDFSSPAARLAVTATLMGMTGHSRSPELIGLLSERLAKIMAGVYDSVVKPLAETLDSRPVRRMAWSASGGLASWVDGEWVGLTGEPVEVGAGWTVIDMEEGPVVDGLPPVQSGRVESSVGLRL